MGVLIAYGVCWASLQVVLAAEDSRHGRQCGVEASSNRLHRDPWLVFIEFYRRGRLSELRCAGALVSQRYVLTAAHCVGIKKFSWLQARLGEYDVSTAHECLDGVCADPVVRLRVTDIYVHPGFDGKEHDIALLRLEEDAPYTDFIHPVCLPNGDLQTSTIFHAAGWGELVSTGQYSDLKKSIPLPYWPGICQEVYKHDVLPKHSFCAGGEEGIDTCRGDSGGPLTDRTKDLVEIWGITSLGSVKCGQKGKPGIYTSVKDYVPWIKEVANLT